MTNVKKLVDSKVVSINMSKTDIDFLEHNRYGKSAFMRQAILKHQQGLWKFDSTVKL